MNSFRLQTIFFENPHHYRLIALDKYAIESLDDRNTGQSPASFGFLRRFSSARISALWHSIHHKIYIDIE